MIARNHYVGNFADRCGYARAADCGGGCGGDQLPSNHGSVTPMDYYGTLSCAGSARTTSSTSAFAPVAMATYCLPSCR